MKQLLTPTKIYVDDINNIREKYAGFVKGFSHITGGGIIDNIPRMFDGEHSFRITNYWKIPEIFKWINKNSDMSIQDMFKTYNCGIGMAIVFDKNTDPASITNLIPMGVVIKAPEPEINYNSFNFT